MKLIIAIISFSLLGIECRAQDTAVLLSPGMFTKDNEQIFIAPMEGWVFKNGNDTAWSAKTLDISGWKKMKPTQLSVKFADANGRVEGWFRIKIKLDSAFENRPLGFRVGTWAASDLYVDGRLLGSFGNTGRNGGPFEEYHPMGKSPVAFNIEPGTAHIIAIHFVDQVSPFSSQHLKSEDLGLNTLVRLTGPGYYPLVLELSKQAAFFNAIWIAVCGILTLLFWLLSFLNRGEKNLLLIAVCSTLITLAVFVQIESQATGSSYNEYFVYNHIGSILVALVSIVMPVILAHIFKRNVARGLKIFLFSFLIVWIILDFVPPAIGNALQFCMMVVIIGICAWYIVSSWKSLKGAQWAIVTGILVALTWALGSFIITTYYPQRPYIYLFTSTGYTLSFPLALLVYTAMRFKEIINEVQQNAEQVVQLSEEKRQRALDQQKILEEEVARQTSALRTTLDNLTATQSQLIQSEKMASLGELTAGIAHEIQNPLNFVNNFSEVNKELIAELKTEKSKIESERDESLENELLNDIEQNSEKINQHGKRADAIVKGMLQHSRSSSTGKEPADISKLTDEYLRLAYHGLRAKDKSFNATLKTDYDESIGNINMIPQDIGRVILNLITNAFYAVNEKNIAAKRNGQPYEPTVGVGTKKTGNKVEISVSDNGNGIPEKIRDKIFQPFFTTKPTGQGTGLGLSLSYDIVKAHGGELKVETDEGKGTKFIMQLPLT